MTRFSTTKLTIDQILTVFPEYVSQIAGVLDLKLEQEKAVVTYLAKNCLCEHPALDITKGITNQAFRNAEEFYLQEVDPLQRESAKRAFDKCTQADGVRLFEIGRSVIYKRFGISESEEVTAELQIA